MINIKTGINEGLAETFAMGLLHLRLHTFHSHHAVDLSIRDHFQFFWKDQGWEYDPSSLHVVG
jgi:hypothetical protein